MRQFLELIQISLRHRLGFSVSPSRENWIELLKQAEKQALIGVCFEGIEKLKQNGGDCPPRDILLQWYAKSEIVRRMNAAQEQEIRDVCSKLEADGMRPCILKGQSLMQYYPATLKGMRQCGDIDVLVSDTDVNVLKYALEREGPEMEWGYKHVHMNIAKKSCVDLHYRLAMSRNLWRNKKIQRWNKELKKRGFKDFTDCGYPTLDLKDNIVFLLMHAFWHFLFEGVGLRQLMDIYFVTHAAEGIDVKGKIKDFGLEKFAGACSWVMWYVFDDCNPQSLLLADRCVLPPPHEKHGQFLLKEIMATGNFGKMDERKTVKKDDSALVIALKKFVHYTRLAKNYPIEFIWLPIGSLFIRIWKRDIAKKVYA